MLAAELLAHVARLAPFELAEEWDNVGLLVGRHNQVVTRVLVALELRDEVLGEARETGCDAVLTHHPVIFPSLSALTDDAVASELALRAAEERIVVLAAHTNLDAARGGLNDVMAELLGLSESRPLRPAPGDPEVGLGRVGRVAPTTLAELAARAAKAFEEAPVSYAGDPETRVERVACCTGSGASLIADARDSGADTYITSDLKYHDADRADGLQLISLPHARTERVALRRWTKTLARILAADGVEAVFATTDTDPWQTA
jgi:dinuclear metal center YbgI/SA1388 family protein